MFPPKEEGAGALPGILRPMNWFKFYGQDWLTDVKLTRLDAIDRLCYLTLLCLASSSDEPGVIKDCDEAALIRLTQLEKDSFNEDSEAEKAKGVLQRLHDNEMITRETDGRIIVVNFAKRQLKTLSGYERVKLYRERQREYKANNGTKKEKVNDNEMITNDNGVITPEKRRVEKKRKDINTKKATLSCKTEKSVLRKPNSLKEKTTPENPGTAVVPIEQVVARKDQAIFDTIELFKKINPSYELCFSNKTERSAAARLERKYGMEKVLDLVKLASWCNRQQYCPASATVHTPAELEKRMGSMIDFYNREKGKNEPERVLDMTDKKNG